MRGRADANPFAADPSDAVAVASDFPAVIDLATLDGSDGFRFVGFGNRDDSGYSVSDAGDVNGDGFGDFLVGAKRANTLDPDTGTNFKISGQAYLIFGAADRSPASFDPTDLDGSNGVTFGVPGQEAYAGWSVSGAGDVNGDGFDDIIIGAPGGFFVNEFGNASYVVFGKADGFADRFDLGALDGSDGFRIDGVNTFDALGSTVSSAGDVNGDGFDDIIVSATRADSYVIFGKADGFSPRVDVETLDGTNGFRLEGADLSSVSGTSVSSAGDVNGDGFDDIIVGNENADPGGDSNAGRSYVVFGKAGGFAAILDLDALDGSNGFYIEGIDPDDRSGISVSSAGDVNGDGLDDLLIGAVGGDPNGLSFAGETYVVFGKTGEYEASFDLASLDGSNGFRIDGVDHSGWSGWSVSSAGDVNGDGFDDIIIGAPFANPGGDENAGKSYVVFGKAAGFGASIDLATLDGSNGFRLDGVEAADVSGLSVSSAGDVNGDGFDDIIIGASGADRGTDQEIGKSYVVYGRAPDEAVTRVGSETDQTIRGGAFDDTLRGKGGDDILAGGGGRDRLAGGRGDDDFLLASTDGDDADRILDFGRGGDRIALDGDVFGLAEGALAAGRFVIGEAAGDANDRLIYDDATGSLFFDADGSGAEVQVLIATLDDAPLLTVGDFVVV